jgi:hypothetical protein
VYVRVMDFTVVCDAPTDSAFDLARRNARALHTGVCASHGRADGRASVLHACACESVCQSVRARACVWGAMCVRA